MNQGRREKIVEMVNSKNTVSNDEIMTAFGVSVETVRRDLAYLEQRGLLERVYGGAVKKRFMSVEPNYLNRESVNLTQKQAIARQAEKLIFNGQTVFFDLGTTVQMVAEGISADKKITVFTNSLRTAISLADKNQTVIIPGGKVRSGEHAVSGSISEDCMADYNVDVAVIGVGGIAEDGITDFVVDEARLRSKVIKNAQKVVVLADFSKIGVKASCRVCAIQDVDVLITDEQAPQEVVKKMEKLGVKVIVAK